MKIIILITLLLSYIGFVPLSSANDMPVLKDNFVEWSAEIVSYAENRQNFTHISSLEIQSDIEKLEEAISQNPNNPRLTLAKGSLFSRKVAKISEELKEKGLTLEERRKDATRLQALSDMNKNYALTLVLDDGTLTMNDYQVMTGVARSADVRVKAHREILRLFAKGEHFNNEGDPGHNENFEYQTYGFMVSAYMDDHDYDNALLILDEIAEKFPTELDQVIAARQRVQEYKNKFQAEQKAKEAEYSKAIADQKQESLQTLQKPTETTDPVKTEKPNSSSTKIQLYILIVVLVLLATGIGIWLRSSKPS